MLSATGSHSVPSIPQCLIIHTYPQYPCVPVIATDIYCHDHLLFHCVCSSTHQLFPTERGQPAKLFRFISSYGLPLTTESCTASFTVFCPNQLKRNLSVSVPSLVSYPLEHLDLYPNHFLPTAIPTPRPVNAVANLGQQTGPRWPNHYSPLIADCLSHTRYMSHRCKE